MKQPALVGRNDFVLVVIDIQERLAVTMARRDAVIASATKLIKTAALVSAPIVITRQYPKGLGDTEPMVVESLGDVAARGAEVSYLDKTAFCACRDESFNSALARIGRQQVVLVGMESHICITQTALELMAAGYEVHVPADGCCSRDAENHAVAMDRMRAAGVVVTTTESVMYEAVGVAGTDEFKGLLGIVKGA